MNGDEELKEKLNAMFDIDGGVIVKTQYCPVGRWVFTLAMTAFFAAVYGVCLWGARLLYGSLLIVVLTILTLALAFVLVRLWLAFAADARGKKFAERTEFVRRGEERYFYTRGRHVRKWEYAQGYIFATKKNYEKFEDKTDFSPLASRYNRALQQRSSLFGTFSPAYWFGVLRALDYRIEQGGVFAEGRGVRVRLRCGDDGKLCTIEYEGSGDDLFDSVSPIQIFNGKIPGKYRITYGVTAGIELPIAVDGIFRTAMRDYLWKLPPSEYVRFESEEQRDENV